MKKFYDRKNEMQALRSIFEESRNTGRFTYVSGQRRVGKTTLLNELFIDTESENFIKNLSKNTFYFFVGKKSEESLAEEFKKIIESQTDLVPDIQNIESLFIFLFRLSQESQITVIFDEFQNFEYVNESIFTSLQKLWDQYKSSSKINLVAIGSLYSSMEKIFASKHEPLFGRPTDRIILKPFKVGVLKNILEDNDAYNIKNLISKYTLFNGIPKYWDMMEYRKLMSASAHKIFYELFLGPRAVLTDEGKTLLIEEFGADYNNYFGILEAISVLSKVNTAKIAKYTGIESQHVNTYLKKLNKKFDLVEYKTSILNPSNKKRRYSLKNRFLKTWFRYVFANMSLVESENHEVLIEDFKQDFGSYMGYAFEDIVLELVRGDYKRFPYEKFGTFWDKSCEIDIVGLDSKKKKVLVGECKLSKSKFNKTYVELFREKCKHIKEILPGYKISPVFFSIGESKKDFEEIEYVDVERLVG